VPDTSATFKRLTAALWTPIANADKTIRRYAATPDLAGAGSADYPLRTNGSVTWA
jgi:hypothetical protein